MISGLEKEKCTGCGVCVAVCPKRCISMKHDEYGFLYPDVDVKKCINCDKCNKFCHIRHLKNQMTDIPDVYVGYNKNEEIRRKSSSGGIFSVLADDVLASGGIVYGVKADKHQKIVHFRADDASDLCKMRGSKYVQSSVDADIYESAKKDILSGKIVLFSGTPCQIGALNTFLSKKYDNLLTVSFICHGVPSPKVWEKYVEWQENVYKSKISNLSFRNKDHGWTEFSMKLKFENGKKYCKTLKKDPFLKVFLKNLCLRPSCYDCSYKGKEILSSNIDFLLADKWGDIGTNLDKSNDDKGLSLIFVQTQKAKQILKKISDKIYIESADYQNAVNSNISYNKSAVKNANQVNFYTELNQIGFEKISDRYAKTPLTSTVREFVIKKGFWICKKLRIDKAVKKIIN